jgi:uncharacterized RmlC-like cupin family protein
MPAIDTRRISALRAHELAEADTTPGLLRELAFSTDRALQIRARVDAGVASGWHHHGDREVLGYLARGRAYFDFGPGGSERTEVEEGGFLHVPAGLVHRDVNPGDEPHEWILVFVGSGPLVVNVDGPEPG